MTQRLKNKFQTEVHELIKTQFKVTNPMALPRLEKIVLSVGLGKQLEGTKVKPAARDQVISDLATITGQQPVMIRARKSVSNFKVRVGYETACRVTLRGLRMWEFFDRLVSMAIPRIKDFRGLNHKSFDGQGNYSFGITEQAIFPEIDMANAKFTHGMHVTFVFKNSSDEKSLAVLTALGVPFAKKEN